MLYCERHEMHNCADCAPPASRVGAPADGWSDWPPASIIIHSSGLAHFPGCQHIVPSDIRPPVYGWVPAPSSGAWRRLAPSLPLRATEGNTGRTAVSRCKSCDATQ
ncbi:hypothetical protein ABT140_02185 [Streptomyces californicus]